eukprot:403351888
MMPGEFYDLDCNLTELKLYAASRTMPIILSWLKNQRKRTLNTLFIVNAQDASIDKMIEDIIEIVHKQPLEVFNLHNTRLENQVLLQQLHDLCFSKACLKDFRIFRKKNIELQMSQIAKNSRLESLLLSGNDVPNQQFIDSLKNLDKTTLQTVRFNSGYCDNVNEILQKVDYIKNFEVYYCGEDQIFNPTCFQNLKSLEFFSPKFNDEMLVLLTSFLHSENCQIERFFLSSQNFEGKDVMSVNEFLGFIPRAKQLKYIQFSLCSFNDFNIERNEMFAELLSSSRLLEKVKFNYCKLQDAFINRISLNLYKCSHFTQLLHLDISYNVFEQASTITNFFKACAINQTLRELTFVFYECPQRLYQIEAYGRYDEQNEYIDILGKTVQFMLDNNNRLNLVNVTQGKIKFLENRHPWRAIYY